MKDKSGILMIVFGVLGLILFFTMFLTILGAFMNLYDATAEVVNVQTGIVTGNTTVGSTTLTLSLFDSDVANVTSISSNATETPVADNYTAPTLYLTALSGNITRTLTTTYDHGILGYFIALETGLIIVPVVLFLAATFGSGWMIVAGARKTGQSKS